MRFWGSRLSVQDLRVELLGSGFRAQGVSGPEGRGSGWVVQGLKSGTRALLSVWGLGLTPKPQTFNPKRLGLGVWGFGLRDGA